ncbi:hypothetical protein [Mesorhizobium australicum]|uniref:Uncharacterized protein n=1 Tax=Mesorhizobium australicum TaxID=536018 RepID=A0A1X7PJS2_9HYPH|nr:hypothetical protein [Mesorhizobium australicum]SMH51935.1 hypothetical protein SAMN02982922_4574 [Mesorhizobium australicum]
MIRQPHTTSREALVANAIQEVVSELRMVDVVDYIAFIRMERFGNISDLVESAAELYFMPGTLKLGHGGEAQVAWSSPPKIVLDLELRPSGATVYFSLTLTDEYAGIEVNYVSFDMPDPDPGVNTRRLEDGLERARIRKTVAPEQERRVA